MILFHNITKNPPVLIISTLLIRIKSTGIQQLKSECEHPLLNVFIV